MEHVNPIHIMFALHTLNPMPRIDELFELMDALNPFDRFKLISLTADGQGGWGQIAAVDVVFRSDSNQQSAPSNRTIPRHSADHFDSILARFKRKSGKFFVAYAFIVESTFARTFCTYLVMLLTCTLD